MQNNDLLRIGPACSGPNSRSYPYTQEQLNSLIAGKTIKATHAGDKWTGQRYLLTLTIIEFTDGTAIGLSSSVFDTGIVHLWLFDEDRQPVAQSNKF